MEEYSYIAVKPSDYQINKPRDQITRSVTARMNIPAPGALRQGTDSGLSNALINPHSVAVCNIHCNHRQEG